MADGAGDCGTCPATPGLMGGASDAEPQSAMLNCGLLLSLRDGIWLAYSETSLI